VKEQLTPVSRLDFLIHPGFQSMGFGGDYDNPGVEHVPSKYDSLLYNYIERAKTLAKDQMMVAFTNILPLGLRESNPTTRALSEIRSILGRRLVVLSTKQGIFPETADQFPDALTTAKRIAKSRGFRINRDTPTEAYGELFGGCVDAAANYMNGRGKFRRKTKIIPDLTDLAVSPEWRLMRRVVGVQDSEFEYPRVSYPKFLRA
jgi:hypothetical protein